MMSYQITNTKNHKTRIEIESIQIEIQKKYHLIN